MAFAAVSSVAQILDQILQHQSFVLENREQVESLFSEVTSLQAILQNSSPYKNSENVESFERRIIDAANKARDLIETHINKQIVRANWIFSPRKLLSEADREINYVIAQGRLVMENIDLHDVNRMIHCSLGMDLDEHNIGGITYGMHLKHTTTFIVGMAGIGKTTLARRVFNSIPNEFSRAWVTLSQSYNLKQILMDLLYSLGNGPRKMHEKTLQQLQDYLYRSLQGTTYLIVLDDLCDIHVFDYLAQILPKDGEAMGQILVTTRLENVAAVSVNTHFLCMTIHRQLMRRQVLVRSSRKQAEYLLKKVSLLHGIFLENSCGKSTEERKSLENQIINAEKRLKAFTQSRVIKYNLTFSLECLTEAKGEIDLVKQLIMEIDKEEDAQHLQYCLPAAALASNITAKDLKEIKNKLAEESSKLEIVSLVGMGGIGKTTLAKQVYNYKFFSECFPIRAWVTVSQSYNLQNVLINLLDSIKKDSVKVDAKNDIGDLSEQLYKRLKGWKYLIVIDDVWDTKVWDDLRRIFPDDKCSSRIMLTTRLKDVAIYANSRLYHVHFLNEDESWNLFSTKVFGEDSCPPQLEEIGKQMVRNCQGLPLAIVVTGGLLSRVTRTQDCWEIAFQNISSLMPSNGNDHCLQILSVSYTHLLDHMKKCFLYTGIFQEGSNILISKLVKLWIAEGFIEPLSSNKLMEDIAYETLLDLVGRSLLLVDEQSSMGKIKRCKIHDLVRDFCIREAKREMFFHITDISLYGIPADAKVPVRLSIHLNKRNIIPYDEEKLSCLEVSSLHIFDPIFHYSMHHLNRKPLRVLEMGRREDRIGSQWELNESLSDNLRYLNCDFIDLARKLSIPSSSVFPKLQTLIIRRISWPHVTQFPNIWNMAQLRHVKVLKLCLSDPIEGGNLAIVLENLQTLSQVFNFRWSNEALGRLPNLKKLGIIYDLEQSDWQHYCLGNLSFFKKMESLTCTLLSPCPSLLHILSFPLSLKKLTLEECCLPWKDMKVVGWLPNLEVLKLRRGSFVDEEWEWELTEEEFPKLKHLQLENLNLEFWKSDSVNFLSLERLIIFYCKKLKELPGCIGEIQTLELIELGGSADSLIDSVKKIQEEQLEFGNDGLKVYIQH